jgi:hypothetical protein
LAEIFKYLLSSCGSKSAVFSITAIGVDLSAPSAMRNPMFWILSNLVWFVLAEVAQLAEAYSTTGLMDPI